MNRRIGSTKYGFVVASTILISIAIVTSSCGYHTAGKAVKIPTYVKTLAIPAFVNQTQTYRIETILTEAVVREFNTRTHYRIVSDPNGADAVLRGWVTGTQLAPLTYDSNTGRASSGLVTVNMRVVLTAKDGRILYENSNYTYREQYQVSRELSSFFEEQGPAEQRLAKDFARTLVSNVLEMY
ncbi:MAG: LPS assembly lipoprotein LptE [Terriglobia bacterium]|nr:LPS assembly lipoprotein LptE [Terriglobia bacterium]